MTIDYTGLIKSLRLPAGFEPPERLTHEDLAARALTRADLEEDVRGINASIELIQRTRGGGWPTEPVTEEFNFAYERGYYDKPYRALQHWVTEAFPFKAPHYSNREVSG